MDEIQFPYRSPTHLLFLHIVEESGAWDNQDLEVEYDFFVGSEDAHEKLPTESWSSSTETISLRTRSVTRGDE